MKVTLISLAVGLIILSIIFPLKFVTVSDFRGRPIALFLVREGEIIEISHINSIYDCYVKEVLRVSGKALEVISVETESHGVREYYGISDGFTPRRYEKITFFNSKDREFSLRVKGKEIELWRTVDQRVTIDVFYGSLVSFLLKFLRH